MSEEVRVSPSWLDLREPADAAARSVELVGLVRDQLAGAARAVIHDLGCGTGSMARWLAPRLDGPQRWVMYDRDGDLLGHAAARLPRTVAGAAITAETRQRDITRLTADDLAGAGLITASALLDMLTADELDRLVAACAGVGCPVLWTLSVVGRVDLTPAHPLDAELDAAFNAHQRRLAHGRQLIGPDAVEAAVDGFQDRGARVVVRPSPWRLSAGSDQAELVRAWFDGWVWAACEQRPDLTVPAQTYVRDRLTDISTGRLSVVVHHSDLVAVYE